MGEGGQRIQVHSRTGEKNRMGDVVNPLLVFSWTSSVHSLSTHTVTLIQCKVVIEKNGENVTFFFKESETTL